MKKKGSILVVFGDEIPKGTPKCDETLSGGKLRSYFGHESIYEATELLEQLPKLSLEDGSSIRRSLMYKGYELWWIHNTDIFHYFCLPYTKFKNLLGHLKEYEKIYFVNSQHDNLFRCYLDAYSCEVTTIHNSQNNRPPFLSFGIFLQIILTLLSLPFIILLRKPILVYTGDKFEKGKDYDFRMKFVYKELRSRGLPFVEFIRGIESWKNILIRAWKRKRPVVYSEGIVFISRLINLFLTSVSFQARHKYKAFQNTPEERFKFNVATQYLRTGREEILSIKIMSLILRLSGIKVAFIPAASERSWHTVIGCKLNNIPTVGIMHGVQSRNYNSHDFLPGYDSDKFIGIDKFGVWSDWWKKYYLENGDLYKEGNLFVSGPMRPLEVNVDDPENNTIDDKKIKVLFLSEEMAVPDEVLPYLFELLKHEDLEVALKFRPSKDGFENWLIENRPEVLSLPKLKIIKTPMQEAIKWGDVAVGCQSTGVIEALLQLKTPIYFRTRKWGDYYNLKNYDLENSFFAESPEELVEKIKKVRNTTNKYLEDLQNRYFGDPYKNGSKWVVDQLESHLKNS